MNTMIVYKRRPDTCLTTLHSKTYHSRACNDVTGLELMPDKLNTKEEKWPSYTMVDPRMRKIYFQFYQETYKSSVLDRKTKELIAIAAALATHCKGCLEGHIKKALKYGATKEELSETIAITMGVSAASMVDLTDIAAENLRIRHFDGTRAPEEPREVSPEE